MPTWEFKSLDTSGSCPELVELSAEQQARIGQYALAIESAAASQVAAPIFSQYFVRESVVAGSEAIQAGNIEYGLCQALHGEESAVAAFRSRRERRVEPFVLGIAGSNPGNRPANPCGNCRDIMREDFGVDFEVVYGSFEGGPAVITRMHQFLFESFLPFSMPGSLNEFTRVFSVREIVQQGMHLENDAYSPPGVHPERKYYVGIFTHSNIYYGALDLMCDYHPIYPLRDAIRQARRDRDPFVESVMVVGSDDSGRLDDVPPHVMYKDRQHLMELCYQQELLSGEESDPRVILVRCRTEHDGEFRIVRAWETSVKEWLPFPFSARNFGPEFVENMTAYCKTRV